MCHCCSAWPDCACAAHAGLILGKRPSLRMHVLPCTLACVLTKECVLNTAWVFGVIATSLHVVSAAFPWRWPELLEMSLQGVIAAVLVGFFCWWLSLLESNSMPGISATSTAHAQGPASLREASVLREIWAWCVPLPGVVCRRVECTPASHGPLHVYVSTCGLLCGEASELHCTA